jgi:AcrR family transcriptional regulator
VPDVQDVQDVLASVPGTSTPTSRVRARSSRRVLDAARELVERDGLDQLSMRRLAAAADVSVRTIYNLFGDRDGVVTALVIESFEVMEAAVAQLEATDPLERIWEAVTISVDSNCRYVPKAVVAAVVADPALYEQLGSRWRGTDLILDAVDAATRGGALRDDLPGERLVEHAGAVFLHALARWAADDIDERALAAMALHAFDVCLLAIARPKARARLLEHVAELEPLLPPLTHARAVVEGAAG